MTTDLKFLEDLLEAAGEKEASEFQRVEALLNKMKLLRDLDITVLDRAITVQRNEVIVATNLFNTCVDTYRKSLIGNVVKDYQSILDILQKLRDIHD